MNAINKTLDVLEVFLNNSNTDLRLSDICKATGLNKSTVSRITATLIDRGYVNQKERRGKYTLTTKFLSLLGELKESKRLREVSTPHMTKLNSMVNESVVLAIRDGNHAVIIQTVNTINVLTTSLDIGAKLPLYTTAVGKIFLANLSEAELDRYLTDNQLVKKTPNTIIDPRRLKTSLKMVREEGMADDDEEEHLGIRNVAVGIHNSRGKLVGSVGVVAPSIRLNWDKILEILPYIQRCAKDISDSIG